MKRFVLVALLGTLAVATFFATTSCKSSILGGPNIPEKQSTAFVDLGAGAGWQELSSLPVQHPILSDSDVDNNLSAFHLRSENDPPLLSTSSNIEFLRFGLKISYAYRLAPSEMQWGALAAVPVTDLPLYPIHEIGDAAYCTWKLYTPDLGMRLEPGEFEDGVWISRIVHNCYLANENAGILPADKSDYKKEGYIYLEFEDISPSPTGLYALFTPNLGGVLFLKKR